MTSLRLRAIFGATVWSAAALLVAGWIIGNLFVASAERQFDAMLESHLTELVSAVAVTERTQASFEARMADPRFQRPLSGLYWQVVAPDGDLLRSRSLWDEALALPEDALADGAIHRHETSGPGDGQVRALERTVRTPRDGAWRIAVAAQSTALATEKARFRRALVVSLLVLGLAFAAAAAAQAAVSLRPLAQLKAALGDYRDGRSKRIAGSFPTEIAPLVEDLNATLESNEKLIARARRRAADLAHALKTPSAALRNALDALPVDAADPNIVVARESLERIDTQTQRQLALARIAVATPGPGTQVAATLERLLRAMTRIHPEKTISLADQSPAEAFFYGDADDLEEMLGNILDNACKWAEAEVSVAITADPGQIGIVIEDDGAGVTPDNMERLSIAGARFDETRDGSGLGLAIVSDIAEAYGGNLVFARATAGGLRVTLTLPGGRRPTEKHRR